MPPFEDRGSHPAHAPRALIADDTDALRVMLRALLEHRGFDVVEAADGVAALDEVGNGLEVDLAVLDCHMPGSTGPEVYEALRREQPDARVLFISGDAGHLLQQLEPDEHWSFLDKPFDSGSLFAAIDRLLAGHRRRPTALSA